MNVLDVLSGGSIDVLGRLPDSSNNAMLCEVVDGDQSVRAVYKPVSGERPLWDFPDGTLCLREMAAYHLSGLLGWRQVPTSAWRDDGPAGAGLLQEWIVGDVDLAVFPVGEVPGGWLSVLRADSERGLVEVAHRDDDAVRRMVLFDAVCNNADRKGGHLLRTGEHRLFGIDHGVTFSTEDKLRTVLWGLAGHPIEEHLASQLASADGRLERLGEWLTGAEVRATRNRLAGLLESGTYPLPSGDWPSLPWPLI